MAGRVPLCPFDSYDLTHMGTPAAATERLARLYALAAQAFGSPPAAARFMMTPHPELSGRTPFDVALTGVGGREVEEVIERGLHGLPA